MCPVPAKTFIHNLDREHLNLREGSSLTNFVKTEDLLALCSSPALGRNHKCILKSVPQIISPGSKVVETRIKADGPGRSCLSLKEMKAHTEWLPSDIATPLAWGILDGSGRGMAGQGPLLGDNSMAVPLGEPSQDQGRGFCCYWAQHPSVSGCSPHSPCPNVHKVANKFAKRIRSTKTLGERAGAR